MGENISTRVAYGRALAEFGADENIYVFDADLKKCTMTLYFSEKYPERFYNIGIAEANMVDVAAGFATCGATALVHTFAIFAAGRVYDQVRNNVCYPGLNVKVVGSHAGLTVGEDGATHQALEDISLMRTIPGMTVIVPCDANETRLGVQLKDGKDVTIIACGLMVQEALKAQKLLEAEGISARVIDMHTIKPIDRDIILKAAEETGAIVTAEEHNVIGGLGAAVAEVLVQNKSVPTEFVGVQDTFGHSASPAELLKHYGLTPENIAEKAKKAISRK